MVFVCLFVDFVSLALVLVCFFVVAFLSHFQVKNKILKKKYIFDRKIMNLKIEMKM